jgi:hypothetical protein
MSGDQVPNAMYGGQGAKRALPEQAREAPQGRSGPFQVIVRPRKTPRRLPDLMAKVCEFLSTLVQNLTVPPVDEPV